MLLAGGLGLIWFVQFQEVGLGDDAPAWSMALVLGVRLLADFVGAWIVISVVRLALVFGRFGLMHLRGSSERGTP